MNNRKNVDEITQRHITLTDELSIVEEEETVKLRKKADVITQRQTTLTDELSIKEEEGETVRLRKKDVPPAITTLSPKHQQIKSHQLIDESVKGVAERVRQPYHYQYPAAEKVKYVVPADAQNNQKAIVLQKGKDIVPADQSHKKAVALQAEQANFIALLLVIQRVQMQTMLVVTPTGVIAMHRLVVEQCRFYAICDAKTGEVAALKMEQQRMALASRYQAGILFGPMTKQSQIPLEQQLVKNSPLTTPRLTAGCA